LIVRRKRILRTHLAGAIILACCSLAALGTGAASGETFATSSPGCTTWTAPSTIYGPVYIRAIGARGGEGLVGDGGDGGDLSASFPDLAAGTQLYLCADIGGGEAGSGSFPGGSGGGGSGIGLGTDFSEPVLVAGGGGGGGAGLVGSDVGGAPGQNGVGTRGGAGAESTGEAGTGAGLSAGGTGGVTGEASGIAGADGSKFTSAGPGTGGTGGSAIGAGGGGGGGGYFGGGGGGGGGRAGGGGGGGSDYCDAAIASCGAVAVVDAAPEVTVTYTALPEFGRCVVDAGGTGHYENAGCTTPSAADSGGYEWTAPSRADFDFTSGPARFATAMGLTVSCAASTTLQGEYSNGQTAAIELTFTGCSISGPIGGQCQSGGAAVGEIVSSPLQGTLGVISGAPKLAVGIVIKPTSGPELMTFKCGSNQLAVTGAVIARATKPDKMSVAFKLRLAASKGTQKPQALEGGDVEALSLSSENGEEAVGLNLRALMVNEQALEIKAIE
jgi:hypothetical protein